jgi:hypothetical protein
MNRVGVWLLPAAEILTVGLPFCVFKLLTGMIMLQSASLVPLGYALLVLGVIDVALNTANLAALLVTRRRVSGVCLLDIVLRRFGAAKGPDLGLALDVFLSFGLVAVVIGFGLLAKLPIWALLLWNAAVVLNVLGAGVGRLFAALRSERLA